eukprot:4199512-Prymnesium_polylepis.1
MARATTSFTRWCSPARRVLALPTVRALAPLCACSVGETHRHPSPPLQARRGCACGFTLPRPRWVSSFPPRLCAEVRPGLSTQAQACRTLALSLPPADALALLRKRNAAGMLPSELRAAPEGRDNAL